MNYYVGFIAALRKFNSGTYSIAKFTFTKATVPLRISKMQNRDSSRWTIMKIGELMKELAGSAKCTSYNPLDEQNSSVRILQIPANSCTSQSNFPAVFFVLVLFLVLVTVPGHTTMQIDFNEDTSTSISSRLINFDQIPPHCVWTHGVLQGTLRTFSSARGRFQFICGRHARPPHELLI